MICVYYDIVVDTYFFDVLVHIYIQICTYTVIHAHIFLFIYMQTCMYLYISTVYGYMDTCVFGVSQWTYIIPHCTPAYVRWLRDSLGSCVVYVRRKWYSRVHMYVRRLSDALGFRGIINRQTQRPYTCILIYIHICIYMLVL